MNVFFDRFRFHRGRAAFALLACMLYGAAQAALPLNLPPISDPASTVHHPGKVVWAWPPLTKNQSLYLTES
jgi:hypothetical protein